MCLILYVVEGREAIADECKSIGYGCAADMTSRLIEQALAHSMYCLLPYLAIVCLTEQNVSVRDILIGSGTLSTFVPVSTFCCS